MAEVYEFEVSQGGGPPAGNYRATFEGVEACDHEEYGPGLRWRWKVVDGPQAGVIASRTTPSRANSMPGAASTMLVKSVWNQRPEGKQPIATDFSSFTWISVRR